MKTIRFLALTFLTFVLITSCSSNDDGDNNNSPTVGIYFPSALDNTWTYDVNQTSSTHPELEFDNETDFLEVNYVSGNTFTVQVNNGNMAYGSMNDILSAGTLTTDDSTLKYSGNLELPADFSSISSQTLNLQDLLLYDLNVSNNSVMSEITGSIEEQFEMNDGTVPMFVDYTLTTKKVSFQNNMTVNGETFTNVIKTRLTLTVDVYTTLPVLGNMSIIDNQDVIIIDNYFAEDIGLIKAETTQEYQINQSFLDLLNSFTPPIELGIATELYVQNVQELDAYLLE